jgi:serine/threonine protein kinase
MSSTIERPFHAAQPPDSDGAGARPEARALPDTDPADLDLGRRLAEGAEALPEVGTDFLGFYLVDELGRGSFSRVYLARQADLADRPVALKVAVEVSGEPQLLARLQHTNIVPIHSAHRAGPLQVVCMPYLGPTTLADVLRDLRARHGLPESGEALVSQLRATVLQTVPVRADELPPERSRAAGATAKLLCGLPYVQATLWIGARLADGLAHAHDNGIVHRDLKPANILMSDEGQPMLLDFNLAEDARLRDSVSRGLLGGTVSYMAPEQLRAFRGEPDAPDARADLYGLGVLLFELLTGRHPFPTPTGPLGDAMPKLLADRLQSPPRLRGWNTAVTPAAEAIIRRCLEPDPARRYQTAQELREDLQRQLDNLPLRHTREPSLRERARKWARRHPRLVSPVLIGALLLVAVSLWGVWAIWGHSQQVHENAAATRRRAAVVRVQAEVERDAAQERERAVKELAHVRAEASLLSQRDDELDPTQAVEDELRASRSALEAQAARCRQALAGFRIGSDPAWQQSPLVLALSESERAELRRLAGELLYLLGRAEELTLQQAQQRARCAPPRLALILTGGGAVWQTAFEAALRARARATRELNRLARTCHAEGRVPQALLVQGAQLARLAGDEPRAQGLARRAKSAPVGTARELFRAARAAVDEARYEDALERLEKAARQAPQHFASWLLRAISHERCGRYEEAGSSYSVCLGINPDCAWAHLARGRTRSARALWSQAEEDLTAYLQARPGAVRAYLGRAEVRQHLQGKKRAAIDDLTHVIECGLRSITVYALRARLREAVNDHGGAIKDREALLTLEPASAQEWLVRGLIRFEAEESEALEDFDRCLKLNPRCVEALWHKALIQEDFLENPPAALRTLDRLLALAPKDREARSRRALLRAREGNHAGARRDAEQCYWETGTPRMQYLVGKVYALMAHRHSDYHKRALDMLASALRNGYGHREVARDPDLQRLDGDPEFVALLRAVRELDDVARPAARKRLEP